MSEAADRVSDLNLDPLGTTTTANQRYVFNANFIIQNVVEEN